MLEQANARGGSEAAIGAREAVDVASGDGGTVPDGYGVTLDDAVCEMDGVCDGESLGTATTGVHAGGDS